MQTTIEGTVRRIGPDDSSKGERVQIAVHGDAGDSLTVRVHRDDEVARVAYGTRVRVIIETREGDEP